MARDLGPRGELPGKHSISFVGPTPQDVDMLDSLVRAGSDRKEGIARIRLATADMPEVYPFSTATVDFEYTKWENSPHGRQDVPHYIVGFDINTQVSLRTPVLFDSVKARQILASLQVNAGVGIYRELPNGKHQIVIPGAAELITLDPATFPKVYTQSPGEKPTTLLELGVTDPQRRFNYLSMLRNEAGPDIIGQRILDRQIKELLSGTTLEQTLLKIHLASNYLHSRGEYMGDNRDLEGEMDRRFGLAYGDLRLDYPKDSKYFGVYPTQINPYFENAAYILEALANSLGVTDLPPVIIPVRLH